MRKTVSAVLLAALVVLPARATPPTRASIDSLLEAAKVEKALASMTANLDQTIRKNVAQSMSGQKLTADDQKTLDAFRVKMAALISEQLNWAKIKDLYEQVYADTFTQAEIDSLIAFYQSPVGRMFAEKQPEIAQKTQVLMQQRMIPVIVKLRSAVTETVNQIQAAHASDADAAQAPPEAPPAAPAVPAAPTSPKAN